jgi:hypothetical protein
MLLSRADHRGNTYGILYIYHHLTRVVLTCISHESGSHTRHGRHECNLRSKTSGMEEMIDEKWKSAMSCCLNARLLVLMVYAL